MFGIGTYGIQNLKFRIYTLIKWQDDGSFFGADASEIYKKIRYSVSHKADTESIYRLFFKIGFEEITV